MSAIVIKGAPYRMLKDPVDATIPKTAVSCFNRRIRLQASPPWPLILYFRGCSASLS